MEPTPLRIAVIMAGGTGERFWPLSRVARPKQLLHLADPDRSLLDEAIERIAPLIPAERILIATSAAVAGPIRAALAASPTPLPPENVIVEPDKRNTAGALAWAASHALARWPGRPVSMAVLTADHRIGDPDRFRATVSAALTAAERERALVTIGVTPTRAETGYGYIEVAAGAEPLHLPASQGAVGVPVFPVTAFREKPDAATAAAFVESGRFFWNSGMFFWRVDSFMEELEAAAPGHARSVLGMAQAIAKKDDTAADKIFRALDDVSIDYALMEKARRVLVARADFPWDDVGAWDALERTLAPDAAGNIAQGDPLIIDSRGCIVVNEGGSAARAVAVLGADDLLVVVAGDAVLVAPKSRAQEVKKIVTELRARKWPQV